jgi:hypothetical protein
MLHNGHFFKEKRSGYFRTKPETGNVRYGIFFVFYPKPYPELPALFLTGRALKKASG